MYGKQVQYEYINEKNQICVKWLYSFLIVIVFFFYILNYFIGICKLFIRKFRVFKLLDYLINEMFKYYS